MGSNEEVDGIITKNVMSMMLMFVPLTIQIYESALLWTLFSGHKSDKKVGDMVNVMYKVFMMTKNVIRLMLIFVSPIIQI